MDATFVSCRQLVVCQCVHRWWLESAAHPRVAALQRGPRHVIHDILTPLDLVIELM